MLSLTGSKTGIIWAKKFKGQTSRDVQKVFKTMDADLFYLFTIKSF